MKLLLDMKLSPRWAGYLAAAGVEATHWSTVGAANVSDDAVMAYAVANGYVVMTHDLDFSAILAASGERSPSVVQIRADDLSPEKIGGGVVAALRQAKDELERGVLLVIEVHRARLRMLPLRSAL